MEATFFIRLILRQSRKIKRIFVFYAASGGCRGSTAAFRRSFARLSDIMQPECS
jgi:hypothetical protein